MNEMQNLNVEQTNGAEDKLTMIMEMLAVLKRSNTAILHANEKINRMTRELDEKIAMIDARITEQEMALELGEYEVADIH